MSRATIQHVLRRFSNHAMRREYSTRTAVFGHAAVDAGLDGCQLSGLHYQACLPAHMRIDYGWYIVMCTLQGSLSGHLLRLLAVRLETPRWLCTW